jgi:hypothetical protein
MPDHSYYSRLQRIKRFFFRENESGYAFAVANNQHLISEINSYLLDYAEIKGKQVLVFDISQKSEYSFTWSLEDLARHAHAIIVNNLWLEIKQQDKDFLLSFNAAREFLNNLKTPILFWVSPQLLSLIFNTAGDLYSQRRLSAVFFDKEPDAKIPEQDLARRFNQDFRSGEDYKKICLRIKLLKKQLDEAKDINLPPQKVGPEIALPLAKLYSSIDLHDNAFLLLEEYKKYLPENNARLYSDLGGIYYKAAKYNEAVDFYCLTAELFKKNTEQDPEDQYSRHNLAVSYSKLGAIHKDLGQSDKALEFFELSRCLRKEL